MITIQNNSLQSSVLNLGANPALATGTDGDKGAPQDYAAGTVYFAADTGKIYQSKFPTKNQWIQYGGSGGGLQDVITNNPVLTTNNTIQGGSYDFYIDCFGESNRILHKLSSYEFNFDVFNSQDIPNAVHFTFGNEEMQLLTRRINNKTSQNSVVGFRLSFYGDDAYCFGIMDGYENAVLNSIKPSYIQFSSQSIETFGYGSNGFTDLGGLSFNFSSRQFLFGDTDGVYNNTYFLIDDIQKRFTFNGNEIWLNGTLTTGSSGSTSGQHLKVRINGTDYVIELKNP